MNQDIYVVIEHLRGQVAEISYVMLAGARELAQGLGGNVVAVLLGSQAQALVGDSSAGSGKYLAADKVLSLDHPALADFTSDAYQKVLSDLIGRDQPRAVLFGSTSIGTDTASTLSVKLKLPLVSSCRSFGANGKFTCQICGGKIMAEGDLPDSTTLVTMVPGGYKADQGQSSQLPAVTLVDVPALDALRVTLAGYIEPEAGDVDITKQNVLVAVGRGIQTQDNIALAEELAGDTQPRPVQSLCIQRGRVISGRFANGFSRHRVPGVRAGDGAQQDGGVRNGAGHGSGGVLAVGNRNDA